jgi:Glycogen debranching enzyme N terminal
MGIDFGRAICGDLHSAETREWIVTNGIGGYASGTVAGLLTRWQMDRPEYSHSSTDRPA